MKKIRYQVSQQFWTEISRMVKNSSKFVYILAKHLTFNLTNFPQKIQKFNFRFSQKLFIQNFLGHPVLHTY